MYMSTPAPFPISYRSIIPRAGECENVFCTFALSASHVAFSSCRMEPVFMIISQSAATAAAFALDDRVPVQSLDYARLALQLQTDRQVIPGLSAGVSGIVVDNLDATGVVLQGEWTSSAATAGYWGGDYVHDGATNQGAKSVTFTPVLPTDGVYEVYLRWTASANRATNVPVEVIHPGGTNTFVVNQQAEGGTWVPLLATNFVSGTQARVVVRNDGASGHVIADAVRFLASNAPPATLQVVATDGGAAEVGAKAGRVTFVRGGDTNNAIEIVYALGGSARNGEDYTVPAGPLILPAGAVSVTLVITPLADVLAEGEETVVISVQAGAQYSVGSLSNATVRIADLGAGVPLRLAPPTRSGSAWSINTSGVPGQVCEFQRATAVQGPWSNLFTTVIPVLGEVQLQDTNPPPFRAFYRVIR
jgi:hypothetical protein